MIRPHVTIVPSSWQGNRGYIEKYYDVHQVILDSFLEDYIKEGNHYQFLIENQSIGYFVIHGASMIVAFSILPEYGYLSQSLFAEIKQFEQVTNAMVPTGDEAFLSHCIDNFQTLEKQAYFSLYIDKLRVEQVKPLALVPADIEKHNYHFTLAEDFLEKKIEKIQQGNQELTIYLVFHGNDLVGFGNIEYSTMTNFASTGMMVLPEYRTKGYGKSILWHLNKLAREKSFLPISGCWYYNHNSKKSMESAGGYSVTRLLKFYF